MRLLFLSNFYPPQAIGGYEQWCHEVALALQERGHQVSVLTSRYGLEHERAAADSPSVRRKLHLMSGLDYYEPLRFFTHWRAEEAYNRRALLAAIDIAQPDLVLVWGMWNLSLNLPYWAEQRLPGRVAYYLSSYWPIDQDAHRAFWDLPANSRMGHLLKQPLRSWARRLLAAAEYPPKLQFCHAVCCSQYVRDTLVAAAAVPAQAAVLHGGTDPKPFVAMARQRKPDMNGRLRFLYFGRLVHDKGVHTILEALAILQSQIDLSKLRLTVLGSGHPDYEAYLHQLVREYQLAGSVDFVSQVERKEVPAWLGRHDVYLFTSIWAEPMARSVMEALAADMLVIGSEVGGQTEMLRDEVNSLTFPPADPHGLASRMAEALAQPEQRAILAAAGQAMVLRDFTLDRMVTNIETWLDGILAVPPSDTGWPRRIQYIGVPGSLSKK